MLVGDDEVAVLIVVANATHGDAVLHDKLLDAVVNSANRDAAYLAYLRRCDGFNYSMRDKTKDPLQTLVPTKFD
ncbi:hypothetical protein Lpp126_16289 [Lacticaseibacillus paracasei subsp. paracasei Lpp126]|uniref:Uncharacterized protein n=1 Tax=Lacticaseibacillus paracasei subsp. paracasei Lpp126 TaxID=1256206 RepID=S2QY04_LACPA|nr:hypothetical protein Lpp126_16289 [Lacticaseibacillus paracasei subsp. paracasei Lpp126]